MALHLLNADQNEHVTIHEVKGFVSSDVHGALNEAYALSKGTKCRQFMYSLSLNPPQDAYVSIDVFEDTLQRVEKRLDLVDQPRVVIFHEKEGRRHAHCVWSRIDTDEMKAINISHPKLKLQSISKQLYLENNWNIPRGFIDKNQKNPLNYTRAEWQQALRTGQDPKIIKAALQESWAISDSKKAFENALQDRGYYLARGDKRGYVALDLYGEVYSLSRQMGVKKSDLQKRLGKTENLSSVFETKQTISGRLTKRFKDYSDELNFQHKREMEPLVQARQTMTQHHREARTHQRLIHEKRWQVEELQRAASLRNGFKGIWDRLTGSHQKTRTKNEKETLKCQVRDRNEKETFIAKQLTERRKLQSQFQQLRQKQAAERVDMFKSMGKQYQKLGNQNEIRKLWEQEKHRMRQTIKNKETTDYDPEI